MIVFLLFAILFTLLFGGTFRRAIDGVFKNIPLIVIGVLIVVGICNMPK